MAESEDKSFSTLFMRNCLNYARKSKNKRAKVGCMFVDKRNRLLSGGYNGEPKALEEYAQYDFDLSLHSEMNAITHSNTLLSGPFDVFITRMPCGMCMKVMAQYEIGTIFYLRYRDYLGTHSMAKNRNMLLLQYSSFVKFQIPNDFDSANTEKVRKNCFNQKITVCEMDKPFEYEEAWFEGDKTSTQKKGRNGMERPPFLRLSKQKFYSIMSAYRIKCSDINESVKFEGFQCDDSIIEEKVHKQLHRQY